MSARRTFDWLRAVMGAEALSGPAKTVAWALAERASANAVAWPKVESIAKDVALHSANVRKHLIGLRESGFLVIEDRRHLNEASWYWLALEGRVVGDLTSPPRPRDAAGSAKLNGERGYVDDRPRETAQSIEGGSSTGEIEQVDLSRLRETALSTDRADPRGATARNHAVDRPRETARGLSADPRGATARNRAVVIKEDPPIDPPTDPQEGAIVDESEPESFGGERIDPRVRGALIGGYQKRYKAATRLPWMSHSKAAADIDVVARWCTALEEPLAAVELVLDAVFADPWMRERKWPWGPIARDPAKYFEAGRKAVAKTERVQARKAARASAERELDESFERARDESVDEVPGFVGDALASIKGRPMAAAARVATATPPPPELFEVATAMGLAADRSIVVAGEQTTPLRLAAGLDIPTLRRVAQRIARDGLRGTDAAAVVMEAA